LVNSKPDDHPDDISWCVGGIGVPQTRRRSTRGSSAAPQDSPGRSAWPSRRASPTSAAATSSPASTAAASASTKISRCPWVPGGRGLALGWGLCGRWCLQVASRGSQRPGYNCTLTTNNSCLLPLCLPTAVMPVCFFLPCPGQQVPVLPRGGPALAGHQRDRLHQGLSELQRAPRGDAREPAGR